MKKNKVLEIEEPKEQNHFDESLFEYKPDMDRDKQLYWLQKLIISELRANKWTVHWAREYANLHVLDIFNRGKDKVLRTS